MSETENKPEEKIPEKLTLVYIQAYGASRKAPELFFDKTPEECTEIIWRETCTTAIIERILEYGIGRPVEITGFKDRLSDEDLSKIRYGK